VKDKVSRSQLLQGMGTVCYWHVGKNAGINYSRSLLIQIIIELL